MEKSKWDISSVSIIISAHNEEKVIAERINNIKSLEFDFSKLEVLIGSDCSTDGTINILTELSNKYGWLKVKDFKIRRGKASVLNDLSLSAQNDILVFTDANTNFDKFALRNLVNKFNYSNTGGVCGRLILKNPPGSFNKINREELYWKYETLVKKYEGLIGVLIGANGGIFGIRKELFKKFPENKAVTDDLYQTLSVLMQNYNFYYAFDAIAMEYIAEDLKVEFKRKIRFAATNFQTLLLFINLLFNRNLLLSYAFWSHKVLRWSVPFILVFLFITNFYLIDFHTIYFDLFIMQLIFYSIALIGFFLSLAKVNVPIVTLIYYYVVTNLALLVGLLKFVFKKHTYIWNSTPR